MRIEREPEIYSELVEEIKRIVRDRPGQSANKVYYDLVSDYGYPYLEKKHWTQEEVYNTIQKMRDSGQIGWNDVIRIPD